MARPSDFDRRHLRDLTATARMIERIFLTAASEAARIGTTIRTPLAEGRAFSFDDYPATRKLMESLMRGLRESVEAAIVDGVRAAWTLSNSKNDALSARIFGDRAKDLTKEQRRRYFSTNGAALDAFLRRKEEGLGLSDKVWRYADAFRSEIEMGLDLGIRKGENAADMARSLRQYLQHPDKLFRRVRDEHGVLHLSKAAAEFHPGTGVYRSSYRNARRLAVTETNMAYHASDHLRWQQMDFVVGIEIMLSGNHTCLGADGKPHRFSDICDELAGKYPKDFKFTGWHPHCRCQAVPVLKSDGELDADMERILSGEEPQESSANTVDDVPESFRGWIGANSERMAAAEKRGTMPYFIRDNRERVDGILSISDNSAESVIIKIGDKEWKLKELIAECRTEPTENGKLYVHPGHGRNELQENLDFARWRAEQFGEEVILLPNPQGVKSADSYNITRRVMEEYKRGLKPTRNSVSQLIRDGKDQADCLIVEVHPDMKVSDTLNAITSRITDNTNPPRCFNLKEIRLKIGDCEAVYSREQIVSKGFKIKPEDFHNVSASRSLGSSLTSDEAGSISDAKLAKFFD